MSGGELKCVNELKYLGVNLVAAKCFKTSVNHLKVKFYRVFNCIYSRSEAADSEMITLQLLKAYCLPLLLYASEAVLLSKSQLQDLKNSTVLTDLCTRSMGLLVQKLLKMYGILLLWMMWQC